MAAVEGHRFDPVDRLFWRNNALDFSSPAMLLKSLGSRASRPELVRARESEDQMVLACFWF